MFGPDADAEGLVLDLLNSQDRYVARRTCSARRRGLGARTTTLVLSEDRVDGAEVLASVDLARSFPGVRTLVLRCDVNVQEGWPARSCAFVARNLAALQQLQHLDLLGTHQYGYGSPRVTAAVLDSIAQLPSLRSLGVWIDHNMEARSPGQASWSALRSLAQLTSLCVVGASHREKKGPSHLQHIAAAAAQLQQLRYDTSTLSLVPQEASSIASLRSLASLSLACYAEGSAHLARALTVLTGLTHLSLKLDEECGPELEPRNQALGQLTGLSSLELRVNCYDHAYLAPLEALQRLTSLSLGVTLRELQDSAVLSRLGALRALEAFGSPAAVAAAGLQRLQSVTVMTYVEEPVEATAPIIQLAAGSRIEVRAWSALRYFDTSQVHVLEVQETFNSTRNVSVDAASQALRSCPQLRGLLLDNTLALHPQVLQAVAACSQLTSLHLAAAAAQGADEDAAPAADGLAALAQGCSRLRRLTLQGIKGLSADMLPALMRLPCLRLLRLLGCSKVVGQEQCQALVGRLGLRELQVDVVVDDMSLRAEWMMERLAEGWMEG
jgi:hypothetical protein